MSYKVDLLNLLRKLSLKVAPEGQEFTLASGKKSKTYLDVRKTALSPEGHYTLGTIIHSEIEKLYPEAVAVAGVALGGCPLASAVSMYSYEYGRLERQALYVRKEAKGYGTGNTIEGNWTVGDKVVLVEDVVTSGGSSVVAVQKLREAGLEVLGLIAVVDRESGAKEAFEAANIPWSALFTMERIIG